MWRENPINWTNLNWIKNALVSTVSHHSTGLTPGEIDIARDVLTNIADEYVEYRDQALGLLHRIPTGTQLWLPTRSHPSLEAQIRRSKLDEDQYWWELYYFLSRFEERPLGRIVLTPRPRNRNLAYLEEQVKSGNVLAIPDYIETHLAATGQPPSLYIRHISYWCHTHQRTIMPASPHRGYTPDKCPRTIWINSKPHGAYVPLDKPCRIIAQLDQLDDWLNHMGFKNNLFAFKKDKFPQPISVKKFLAAFFQTHQNNPAYLLFRKEIEDYFRVHLAIPMQIIAELNITQSSRNYPVIPLTWKELVLNTNLREDLIEGIPNFYLPAHFANNIGFLLENYSPTTLLRFCEAREYRPGSGYWETGLPCHGLIVENERYHYTHFDYRSTKPATVRFGTFG